MYVLGISHSCPKLEHALSNFYTQTLSQNNSQMSCLLKEKSLNLNWPKHNWTQKIKTFEACAIQKLRLWESNIISNNHCLYYKFVLMAVLWQYHVYLRLNIFQIIRPITCFSHVLMISWESEKFSLKCQIFSLSHEIF